MKEMDEIDLMFALMKETDKDRITELQNKLNYKCDIEREIVIETEKNKNYQKLNVNDMLNVEIMKELKNNIDYIVVCGGEYRIKYRGDDGYDRNITYNKRRDDIEIYIFGDYERIIIDDGREFIMNWLRERKLNRICD